MNNTFPIPVQTPVIEGSTNQFSAPWLRFLQAVGRDLVDMCVPRNASESQAMKYVVNGNLCFATFYTQTPLELDTKFKLPFTALFAFDIASVIYAPSTTTITIPAGTTYQRFDYVCRFQSAST
jgi:hypothetical protein